MRLDVACRITEIESLKAFCILHLQVILEVIEGSWLVKFSIIVVIIREYSRVEAEIFFRFSVPLASLTSFGLEFLTRDLVGLLWVVVVYI